jgi:hypothetical protein
LTRLYAAVSVACTRQTEAAHIAAYGAIDAYAAVAKNRADAGAVATMAEHVCRQLNRRLQELRAAHDKAR